MMLSQINYSIVFMNYISVLNIHTVIRDYAAYFDCILILIYITNNNSF